MKDNMGTADRIIRFAVSLIIAFVYYMGIVTGATAIVLSIIGALLFITAIAGTCPLYSLLGISTCKKKEKQHEHGDVY